jgi:hypothetical protein
MGFKRRTFSTVGYAPVTEDTTDRLLEGAKAIGVDFDPEQVIFKDPAICSEGARKVKIDVTVDIEEID